MAQERYRTGVPGLDERLGGGLLPGTLTVIMGATGIGKTQLGLQFAQAGQAAEGRRGIVFDMTARGDSQGHTEYAQRMFNWQPVSLCGDTSVDLDHFFDPARQHGEYLHVFDYRGRRVTRNDLDWEAWQYWQTELNAKLRSAIAFLYGNLLQGTRRVIIDGIEPADRPQESVQFQLFEYVYHQVLRKDPEWVARDLLRESYRKHAAQAAQCTYDPGRVACVLLYTSHQVMLDELISRCLDEGDVLANANTLLLMGKYRDGNHIRRALYIAKHRGSACSEEIIPYEITSEGLRV